MDHTRCPCSLMYCELRVSSGGLFRLIQASESIRLGSKRFNNTIVVCCQSLQQSDVMKERFVSSMLLVPDS